MPTYAYICTKCKFEHEFFQWFSDPLPIECPKCKAGEEFYHQNYQENNPMGWTYGEDRATTCGQQSHYNIKRLGKEKWEEKKKQHKNFKGRQYEDL